MLDIQKTDHYQEIEIDVTETNCFRSFRNIKRNDYIDEVAVVFQVTHHVVNQNFGKLIEPIFGTPEGSRYTCHG